MKEIVASTFALSGDVKLDWGPDDIAAWEGQYEIFRNMDPERQIIGYLAGEGYLAVWARDGSNTYAQDLAERAFDGSVYEPQRGPRADPSPR